MLANAPVCDGWAVIFGRPYNKEARLSVHPFQAFIFFAVAHTCTNLFYLLYVINM